MNKRMRLSPDDSNVQYIQLCHNFLNPTTNKKSATVQDTMEETLYHSTSHSTYPPEHPNKILRQSFILR